MLSWLRVGRTSSTARCSPHTCDSVQGLATLLGDFGGWTKPAIPFLHPKGTNRPSARFFLTAELRRLATALEGITGQPLDPDRLREAIDLHQAIDACKVEILRGRARLPLDDRTLYAQLRRGEFLWPEDHLQELEVLRAQLGPEPVQRGTPVAIIGYVPEPMALLSAVNEAGAYVAVDDYARGGATGDPRCGPFSRRPVRDADRANPLRAALPHPYHRQ